MKKEVAAILKRPSRALAAAKREKRSVTADEMNEFKEELIRDIDQLEALGYYDGRWAFDAFHGGAKQWSETEHAPMWAAAESAAKKPKATPELVYAAYYGKFPHKPFSQAPKSTQEAWGRVLVAVRTMSSHGPE